jgi:predicted DNA-binding ribbon-helix-helix protein
VDEALAVDARENLTTSQFAVKLYDELIALRGELPTNFASFLRVCCLRYLSMRAEKEMSAGDTPPGVFVAVNEVKPQIPKTV